MRMGLLGKERLVTFVPIRVHSLRPSRAYSHDGASGRPVQGLVRQQFLTYLFLVGETSKHWWTIRPVVLREARPFFVYP